MDGVQFAFHYVHPNDENAGQLAIDNVKLMAVETGEAAQKYTITATAGEGGSITPNGDVSVKEGASRPSPSPPTTAMRSLTCWWTAAA